MPSQTTIFARFSSHSTRRAGSRRTPSSPWSAAPEAANSTGRTASRRSAPVVTARERFGTVAPPLRAKTHDDRTGERGISSAPRRLSRVVRPDHQWTSRHHRPSLPAVRRGLRRGDDQPVQEGPVRHRGADRAHPRGDHRLRQRARRVPPRPARGLLQRARHPRDRQGPARRQRLRLRAADGPDEQRPHRRRDAVRADQPHLQLPVLLARQGGRGLGRRRLPPGAAGGRRRPQQASAQGLMGTGATVVPSVSNRL
ncbi:exported hypothetical protein [Streptomyces misionensis JCM 4497]